MTPALVKQLLRANTLFHFGRMFSGAVFIIYMFDRSISLQTIAAAKAAQLVASTVLMIPTGVIADCFGRKKAIVGACLFEIVYFTFLLSPSPMRVVLGEICNGIALALYSGAFESWLFSGSDSKHYTQLHHDLARARELSYMGMVVAGFLGSLWIDQIFWLSIIFTCVSSAFFVNCPETHLALKNVPSLKTLKIAAQQVFSGNVARYIAWTAVFVGGSMQLIYQYWQPFFLKLNPKANVFYGTIFVCFMSTQFFVSWVVRKYLKAFSRCFFMTNGLLWILAAIFMSLLLSTKNLVVSVIFFCCFQGIVAAGLNLLTAGLGQDIAKDVQATAMSLLDFLGRILGAVLLVVVTQPWMPSRIQFGWPIFIGLLVVVAGYAFVRSYYGRRNSFCTE